MENMKKTVILRTYNEDVAYEILNLINDAYTFDKCMLDEPKTDCIGQEYYEIIYMADKEVVNNFMRDEIKGDSYYASQFRYSYK